MCIVFQTRSDREQHPGTAIMTVTAHIYLEWTLMVPSIVRMLANKAPPSTRTHIYLAKRRWSHTVSYPHQMMRNLDMALLGRPAPGQY